MCGLILENPDKLQITRIIKDFGGILLHNVFFTYDKQKYLLVWNEEGGEGFMTLYKRFVAPNGYWTLEYMDGNWVNGRRFTELIKPQTSKTIVYKLIDKEYFIQNLNQLLGYAK